MLASCGQLTVPAYYTPAEVSPVRVPGSSSLLVVACGELGSVDMIRFINGGYFTELPEPPSNL